MSLLDILKPHGGTVLYELREELNLARAEIRQGRFRRTMAVMTTFAALVSGFEAFVQHRRGDFYSKLMWTPIVLTPPVTIAAVASMFSQRAVLAYLPVSAAAALISGMIGFFAHLNGISKLPGGYKHAQYNIVMGPPIFAPLLISIVGVLGLLASWLRPERLEDLELPRLAPESASQKRARKTRQTVKRTTQKTASFLSDPLQVLWNLPAAVAQGRFERVTALITAVFALLAGGEAFFEHLRGSFNRRWMWTPVWVSLPVMGAALGAIRSEGAAKKFLPVASVISLLDGLVGFWLHLRGLKRMPGGFQNLSFNVTLGPPLFAPLLFSAVGLLGMIASILRRRTET